MKALRDNLIPIIITLIIGIICIIIGYSAGLK